MKFITSLSILLLSITSLLADTPIPDDSKSPWDYRGSKSLTNEAYEALFECETYEELIPKLEIAIEALELGADCLAPHYVASGCRLARIRAYYVKNHSFIIFFETSQLSLH